MPTLRSSWVYVDLSPTISVANNDRLVVKPVPVAGTVKEVWVSVNTAVTTGGGLVAVAKGSTNLLSATNVDLQADLSAATPSSRTLTTNTASLKVATTDVLKATWTLTTIASTNSVGCLVAIEPDVW